MRYIEKLRGWCDCKSEVFALEVDPKLVDVVIHAQEEWNGAIGIRREKAQEYTILERGRKVSGSQEVRRGTISYREHIRRFEASHPQRRVLAFVANGNLLFNPWFVAWIDGRLFHLRDEPLKERTYSSLIVWREGHEPPASIEDLKFENGKVLLVSQRATDDITDRIKYTTFGQRLVKEHRPVGLGSILDQFYDLRHLLPALYYSDGQGTKYTFGLDQLRSDEHKKRLAVMKHPVDLRLEIETVSGVIKVDPQRLRSEALLERDFEEVKDVRFIQREGQYAISPDGGTITIRYRPNIYPHNMIGVTDEGKILSVVVTGLSGRAGISVEKASRLLVDVAVKDAILLSNGGDVMMQYLGNMIAESSENRRRLRSVILFARNKDQLLESDPVRMGLSLTRHPSL